MFTNYLASALRNLLRNRLYAGITIGGLAIGFAAAILIGLFVRDELTYDRFIPGHESLYRVSISNQIQGSEERRIDSAPPEFAQVLLKAPQVKEVARLGQDGSGLRRGPDFLGNIAFAWADANFFELVPLPVFAGDLKTALQRPDSMVITRTMARQYFGKDNPIGEIIDVSPQRHPMRVTAVLEDPPSNTHLGVQIFLPAHAPWSRLALADAQPWKVNPWIAHTYFRLAPGASVEDLRRSFPTLIKSHTPFNPDIFHVNVTALADIHLSPPADGAMKARGTRATIYAIAAIGLLILLAASINFVNLMTARATRRAIEVGVRKAFGADRKHMIVQFIGESVLYVLLGALLGVAIVELLLPSFNAFLDRSIQFHYWTDPPLIFGLLALSACVGVLAGAYPALVLSSFRTAQVLKDARGSAGSAHLVRHALVIVQFAILIGLAIATIIIYQQTRFSIATSLRLQNDEIYLLQSDCTNQMEDALRALPGVRAVTCSNELPLGINPGIAIPAKNGGYVDVRYTSVDFDYFDFYNIAVRAGRTFSEQHGGDLAPPNLDVDPAGREAVILNEAAARLLQFDSPQAAVGQSFTWSRVHRLDRGPATMTLPHTAEIIGVVEDFQMQTVRNPIPPAVFYVDAGQFTRFNIKLAGASIPETVAAIEKLWKKIGGPKSFFGFFLKQTIESIYTDLKRQMAIIAVFAGIAMLIGCLGLFGLSAFNAERRTKEIGVRKALGADTFAVMRLLTWQFMKPVLWANLIAWPVSALLMHRWLQGFVYRIDIEPWVFAAATIGAMSIALLTVAGHCYLAARSKPVNALRYE